MTKYYRSTLLLAPPSELIQTKRKGSFTADALRCDAMPRGVDATQRIAVNELYANANVMYHVFHRLHRSFLQTL